MEHTDELTLGPSVTVLPKEGLILPVTLVVKEIKEALAWLVTVKTDGLTLGLPLKVHGVSETLVELVLDASGDLLVEADVKLADLLANPDEVCVLSAVREIDADIDSDFDPVAIGDWVSEPEMLFDLRAVTLDVVEALTDLLREGEPLEEPVLSELTEADLDILVETVELKEAADETIADPE